MSVLKLKEVRQNDLYDDVLNCKRCDLCSRTKAPIIGYGNLRSDLVFVGEAPGLQEEAKGYPFVREAPAGAVLTNAIQEVFRCDRMYFFITNAVLCRPTSQTAGKQNDTPEKHHLSACSSHLEEQISIVDPKVIVALGKVAADALTGLDLKAGEYRNKLFWYYCWPVICTWHPAYVVRGGSNGLSHSQLLSDLQRADSIRCHQTMGLTQDNIKREFESIASNTFHHHVVSGTLPREESNNTVTGWM